MNGDEWFLTENIIRLCMILYIKTFTGMTVTDCYEPSGPHLSKFNLNLALSAHELATHSSKTSDILPLCFLLLWVWGLCLAFTEVNWVSPHARWHAWRFCFSRGPRLVGTLLILLRRCEIIKLIKSDVNLKECHYFSQGRFPNRLLNWH